MKIIKFNQNNNDFEIVKSPFLGIPKEELSKKIAKISSEAKKNYEEDLTTLKDYIKQFDTLNILCHFSTHQLITGNYNPSELGNPILQFHIEILQALLLQINQQDIGNKNFNINHGVIIEDLIKRIPNSLFSKKMADIDSKNEEEQKQLVEIEMFRIHTMAVRNWGYAEQIKRILKELFEPLDKIIKEEIKLSVLGLIEMLEAIIQHIEDKLNKHHQLVKSINASNNFNEVIDRFIEIYPDENRQELLKKSKTLPNENFSRYIIGKLNQKIHEIYTFDINLCEKFYPEKIDTDILKNTFDKWSFKKGELENFPTEYIFLGNPIWSKPLINLSNEKYCWPVPGIFISFGLEMIENIINDNIRLKNIYAHRRGRFLEQKIEEIVKKSFKKANVYNNLVRLDEDGENDLLILIDTFAVIIEAKSGKISDSARRGSLPRLIKEIQKLIVDPSNQAKNFRDYIQKNLDNVVEFTNKNNEEIFVDFTNVQNILTYSITFDLFGPLASRTPGIFESNLLDNSFEIVPSMTLIDLEILFEILEKDTEKLHYLKLRPDFDKKRDYHADELDLIAFYLKTGFNMEKYEDLFLQLYGFSQEVLDPYFISKNPNRKRIPKPKLKITKYWQKIIKKNEYGENLYWSDIGIQLLNVSYDNQILFKDKLKKLKKTVRKHWRDPNQSYFILSNEYEKKTEIIICYAYKKINQDEINKNIINISKKIMSDYNVEKVLFMSLDIENLGKKELYTSLEFIELI